MGLYVGEFQNDEMHGNGTFTFSDGSEYIGEFENGLQHGQGLLLLQDGTKVLGKWEHGDQVSIEYSIDLNEPEEGQEGGEEQEQNDS